MCGCIVLFVSAWTFVRFWSITAAVVMCVVAMVIPPVAAMIGNARGRDDRWWDESSSGDPTSDEWWDELEGRKKPTSGKKTPEDGKNHRRDRP